MSSSAISLEPVAIGVYFRDQLVVFRLADGREVAAPLAWFPRLVQATQAQRENWRLIGRGDGVHWPDVDEDISVALLLGGRF